MHLVSDPPRVVVIIAPDPAQELDVTGPTAVFSAANKLSGHETPPYELHVASVSDDAIIHTESGLRILADAPYHQILEQIGRPIDTLLISGGAGHARAAENERLIQWLRVPQMQPEARAALNGVSMATTQAEIAHAILEGIAHSVASCIDANRDIAGIPVTELVVGGGLSGSDTLLQMQADLTGLPIHRMQETDRASLRGIAWLAGASGLLWDSLDQARTTTEPDAVFVPRVGADERAERRALWHARVASELNHVQAFATH